MEYIDELVDYKEPRFENVAGLYINNPNQMSYLLFLANQKRENLKEINSELAHYLDLMIAMISDYARGIYKKIPIKTLIYTISALAYLVRPKKSFINKVPGIKILKELGLLGLVLKSIQKDLRKYEKWKENPEEVMEV